MNVSASLAVLVRNWKKAAPPSTWIDVEGPNICIVHWQNMLHTVIALIRRKERNVIYLHDALLMKRHKRRQQETERMKKDGNLQYSTKKSSQTNSNASFRNKYYTHAYWNEQHGSETFILSTNTNECGTYLLFICSYIV